MFYTEFNIKWSALCVLHQNAIIDIFLNNKIFVLLNEFDQFIDI